MAMTDTTQRNRPESPDKESTQITRRGGGAQIGRAHV